MDLDRVPIYPGCESLKTNDALKKCMSKNVIDYVVKHFNPEVATKLGLEGRLRIYAIFKIDETGNVIGVRSRAPHLALEQETIKVINALPRMKPGEHKGKKVTVPFSLPIIYQVVGDKNNKKHAIKSKHTSVLPDKDVIPLNEAVIVGYK